MSEKIKRTKNCKVKVSKMLKDGHLGDPNISENNESDRSFYNDE